MGFSVPFLLQAKTGDPLVTYTSTDVRTLLKGIWPTEGVVNYTSLNVSPRSEGANLSVDVAVGSAVVQCDTATPAGLYFAANLGVKVNVPLPAAPPSGSRTHFIVCKIHDGQNDGGSLYTAAAEVAADTGGGATLPPSALKLAEVTVAHGQSQVTAANINDTRAFAYTFGVPAPQPSGHGTIAGTFVPGKPVLRQSGYTEKILTRGDGKFTVGCPDGATAILDCHLTPAYHDDTAVNMAQGWVEELHAGGTSDLNNMLFSARDGGTGNPILGTTIWIGYSWTFEYQ